MSDSPSPGVPGDRSGVLGQAGLLCRVPPAQAAGPRLLAEDDPDGQAAQRTSGVAPARRSAQAKQTVRTQRTADGDNAMSYARLMKQLSGLGRRLAVPKIPRDKAHPVPMMPP